MTQCALGQNLDFLGVGEMVLCLTSDASTENCVFLGRINKVEGHIYNSIPCLSPCMKEFQWEGDLKTVEDAVTICIVCIVTCILGEMSLSIKRLKVRQDILGIRRHVFAISV